VNARGEKLLGELIRSGDLKPTSDPTVITHMDHTSMDHIRRDGSHVTGGGRGYYTPQYPSSQEHGYYLLVQNNEILTFS